MTNVAHVAFTFMRLSINAFVKLQIAGICVSLSAFIANVLLPPSMNVSFVSTQVTALTETLAAVLTAVRLFASMNPLV